MSFSFHLEPHETVQIIGARRIGSVRTSYQLVEIVDIPGLGETIFIDGFPQISATDRPIFNELIAHAPVCAAQDSNAVFVAGVASGGALAEILKHSSVQSVYAVDIDEEAINFYRKHLSFWNSQALADSRVTLLLEDAREVLAHAVADCSLDVIIVDLPDPHETSPSRMMFTYEFYVLCRRKLKPNGVLLTQAGRFRLGAMSYHRSIRATCKAAFEQIKTYQFYYPCYYEPWSFLLCASEAVRFPSADQIDNKLKRHGVTDLRYYSGAIDTAVSEIPFVMYQAANEERPILHDR